MTAPLLYDVFCGAGGCTRGYQMAGFRVIGVDNRPQKNYCGDGFYQMDIFDFFASYMRCELEEAAAIHASPPCQGYSALAAMHPGTVYPLLIEAVRACLVATGLPYVIENVERAPVARRPQLDGRAGVMLCGSMFGLGIERGQLRRHRLFEMNFGPVPQLDCHHRGRAVGVYGHGGHSGKHRMLYREEAAVAMGIDWMNRDELTQSIPPLYTKWIGDALMLHLAGDTM